MAFSLYRLDSCDCGVWQQCWQRIAVIQPKTYSDTTQLWVVLINPETHNNAIELTVVLMNHKTYSCVVQLWVVS